MMGDTVDGGGGVAFNFNVGMLGHVDSGKTSLAKALSTTASTAAFDKNPQSRERGITLDLGFSSFVDKMDDGDGKQVQYTLVDCPGHASLIRASKHIIGFFHTSSAIITNFSLFVSRR